MGMRITSWYACTSLLRTWTVSSSIVSARWSAIIAQDVVGPLVPGGLSDAARLRLTRLTVIALALFILVWSLVYKVPGPAYFYLQVTANLFMAPTLLTVAGANSFSSAGAECVEAPQLLSVALETIRSNSGSPAGK